jgi:para-aminobenzoate synthetase
VLRPVVHRLSWFPDAEDVFATLFAHASHAYWLDSSRAEMGLARFSYMGSASGPLASSVSYSYASNRLLVESRRRRERLGIDVFAFLKRELGRLCVTGCEGPFDFVGGFVGYFGYELKALCGGKSVRRSALPDAAFVFSDRFVVFDHAERACYLVCLVEAGGEQEAEEWFGAVAGRLAGAAGSSGGETPCEYPAPTFHLRRPHRAYVEDIATCQRYLHDGESYEICLTNQVQSSTELPPWQIYRALRRVNPAPFAAFLKFGGMSVLSSSPERFLRIDRHGLVEAKPIKGTEARGSTPEEDQRNRRALERSEKDRAENLMIVDLLRNDLGRVCEVGTVHVPKLMDIETYETVHQMVSTIRGRLRRDRTVVDCIKAAFPGGSMTGAPKIRTMEIIDLLEPGPRGIYSGALGYLSLSEDVDLNIVIRTLVDDRGGLSIGTGGAITVQSVPEAEFRETIAKALPVMRAVTEAGSATKDPWGFTLDGVPGRLLKDHGTLGRPPLDEDQEPCGPAVTVRRPLPGRSLAEPAIPAREAASGDAGHA